MTKNSPSWLQTLSQYAGKHRYLLILGMLLTVLTSVFAVIPYLYIWQIIKALIIRQSENILLMHYAWMAFLFAALSVIAYFIALTLTHLAAFRVERTIRSEAIKKLMQLPLGFFDHHASGKIRRIINDNAAITHTFIAHQLPDIAGALTLLPILLIVLFVFDWRFGIICLLVFFLACFAMAGMMGKNVLAESMKKYMDSLENMNKEAVEYVRGIPVVKVFQQTVFSFKKFHQAIMDYKNWVSAYAKNCQNPMVICSTLLHTTVLFLLPPAYLLLNNSEQPTAIITGLIFYIIFIPFCSLTLMRILYLLESINLAQQALTRIDQLFDQPLLKQPEQGKSPKQFDIEFAQVDFSYPGKQEKVLHQLSFHLPENGLYALVGASGSGKSTIASLIPRLWDVESGAIRIGGIDIREIKQEELMQNIAYVCQQPRLFKGSVRENIVLSQTAADEESIQNAIRAARCEEIIEHLPKGLDTQIGSQGVYLSGGEAQRLVLARAFLKNAPIIILDEATAFADPENEYLIQQALLKLIEDKTVLMIAHRLHTVQNADNILVVDQGKIIESGTHAQLLYKNAHYKQLWDQYQRSVQWQLTS